MLLDHLRRRRFRRSLPAEAFQNPEKLRVLLEVKPFSVNPYARLANLYDLAHDVVDNGLAGSFVECGSMNGGTAGILASAARRDGRHLWLFDSWRGLPKAETIDVDFTGRQGFRGLAWGFRFRVRKLLFGIQRNDPQRVHLVQGWFQNSLPARLDQLGPIALLHVDCDWRSSVTYVLDTLYDRVVPGGVVVIDDYGYWKGAEVAFEEFLRRRNLKIERHQVDVAVFFRKPHNAPAITP